MIIQFWMKEVWMKGFCKAIAAILPSTHLSHSFFALGIRWIEERISDSVGRLPMRKYFAIAIYRNLYVGFY